MNAAAFTGVMINDGSSFRSRGAGTRMLCALLAAGGVTAAAGSAAALQPPDLMVSISGPSSVQAGTSAAFSVTITNVPLRGKVCRPGSSPWHPICGVEVVSDQASGVRVDVSLPGFTLSAPPSPGGGFTCAGGASCTGGTLLPGDVVTIPITAVAGNVTGTFTYAATVDPANSIVERDETNNGAGVAVAITPHLLPDLVMLGSVVPSPFSQFLPVLFDLTVHNLGSAGASNITIQLFTNLPAALSSWTLGGGFVCGSPSNFGQRLEINCSGGNLAAASTAPMKIYLKVLDGTNPFGPPSYPSGTPFSLFGFIDLANNIPESNETNNNFTFSALIN